jgi:hypothetical protein
MRRSEIWIGGFYTKDNGLFAREVIGDDGMNIIYRDYALRDGQPISTRSLCGYSSFASWAHRECTPDEKARCNVPAMERKSQEESDNFKAMLEIPLYYAMYKVLDAINTEYIVAYLESKGYEVTKVDEEGAEPNAADGGRDRGSS